MVLLVVLFRKQFLLIAESFSILYTYYGELHVVNFSIWLSPEIYFWKQHMVKKQREQYY